MEPHSYECGNSRRAVYDGRLQYSLQWSRTLTSAEIKISDEILAQGCVLLQWSRTLTSAEMGDRYFTFRPFENRFNGAALLRVRK